MATPVVAYSESSTKVVGTLPLNVIFSLLARLRSLPMLFIAVKVSKSFTPTLGGQENSKVSQQF